MNYYNRYKKQIETKIADGLLTEEYIEETTERLDYYFNVKKKLTREEYNYLIALLNQNEV